jgi:hypothetical protein
MLAGDTLCSEAAFYCCYYSCNFQRASTTVLSLVGGGGGCVYLICENFLAYSLAKQLESGNTMFSFVWWMFGFGLIISGGEVLIHKAPHLYW